MTNEQAQREHQKCLDTAYPAIQDIKRYKSIQKDGNTRLICDAVFLVRKTRT